MNEYEEIFAPLIPYVIELTIKPCAGSGTQALLRNPIDRNYIHLVIPISVEMDGAVFIKQFIRFESNYFSDINYTVKGYLKHDYVANYIANCLKNKY